MSVSYRIHVHPIAQSRRRNIAWIIIVRISWQKATILCTQMSRYTWTTCINVLLAVLCMSTLPWHYVLDICGGRRRYQRRRRKNGLFCNISSWIWKRGTFRSHFCTILLQIKTSLVAPKFCSSILEPHLKIFMNCVRIKKKCEIVYTLIAVQSNLIVFCEEAS